MFFFHSFTFRPNRSVQGSETIRPDGAMYLKKQRHTKYACGFVEVKSKDNEEEIGTHNDLFRLGKFCEDTLDNGFIKALVAVQVLGKSWSSVALHRRIC
jgi:hypothetical protein